MMRNTNVPMKNLKNQIVQMAKIISEQLPRSLPSNTEVNPKEALKVVNLRSGKEISPSVVKKPNVVVVDPQPSTKQLVQDYKVDNGNKILDKGRASLPEYQPKLPYLAKVKNNQQEE